MTVGMSAATRTLLEAGASALQACQEPDGPHPR